MPIQYTNRVGKTYYLSKGVTKKGNPKYSFSLDQQGKGEAVEKIPNGYEIYEHPSNCQVFLRKKLPQLITELEKKLVTRATDKLRTPKHYRVDCKNEFITIYQSDVNINNLKKHFTTFLRNEADQMKDLLRVADQNYSPVLRFCLIDKEQRLFLAERLFLRASIDDWIPIGSSDHLKEVVKKYVKLLGTEDFYEFDFFLNF